MIRFLLVLALATPLAGAAEPLRPQAAAPQQRSPEEVKAGLLLAIARKTGWPERALPKEAPHFVIGLIGPAAVTEKIQAVLGGQKARVGDRPIRFVVADGPAALAGAHLVYLADDGSGQVGRQARELLEAFRGKPTLTVGEVPGFAADGGIVNFYTEPVDRAVKLRFELNPKAAEKSGLNVTDLIPVAPRVVK